jgi:hypothetical protein
VKKTENVNAIISVTELQKYIFFFFEISDQGVVNSLDMVLILKSETKVGRVNFQLRRKNFFSVLKEKSFAALRFAHNKF